MVHSPTSDEMTRLGNVVRMQGQENLVLRQEILEVKRKLNTLEASGAGLKTSLSRYFYLAQPNAAQANLELVARIEGLLNEYGFRGGEIHRALRAFRLKLTTS